MRKFNKTNNPTREGYKFLGWYTDDSIRIR
ncbi:MAG: InlB B-repeat-containing protein [Eubacterium ventriosum]